MTAVRELDLLDLRSRLLLREGTSDLDAVRQVFYERQYEYPLGFEPQVIVDAGANIGCASLYFATVYPAARIVAIEPEPCNFDLLCHNVRDYPKIEPVKAALWGWNALLRLKNPQEAKWAFEFEESADGDTPGITVLDLLRWPGITAIDLLKLDVEGAEREIFQTADWWLDRVRAVVVELHDEFTPGCGDSFRELVAGRASRIVPRGENLLCLFDRPHAGVERR